MFDVRKIQGAFSPAQEIHDPQLFAGRKDQIRRGMVSLINPGACLAIYGLRGVGKSSVARQLQRIAQGDQTLPGLLDLARYSPENGFAFLTHYVQCDFSTPNIWELLKRILFGDDRNPSLFTRASDGDRRLEAFRKTVASQREAGFFGARIRTAGAPEKTSAPYISDSIVQQLQLLLGTIRHDHPEKSGLLIVIDGLEFLRDKSGLASLIKTCSSDYVKFALVGISATVTALVPDPFLIGRQMETIEIGRMAAVELEQILERAEERVEKYFEFAPGAREIIIQQSEGFPFFVHVLGREAMLLALERHSRTINRTNIEELNPLITRGGLGSMYEELYYAAVKNSPQRETLLKLFAESKGDEIFSEEIYRIAREFEVAHPAQLMKELTSGEHREAVLVKIRNKYYRFADPVFKVYARTHHWKFDATAKQK